MAVDFIIPNIGDNVKEATIVSWLVEDGAEVDEGTEVLEVETDKAVLPIPANASGHLHRGPYKAGDVVPISTVVATIGGQSEGFAPGSGEAEAAEATSEAPAETKQPSGNGRQAEQAAAPEVAEAPAEDGPRATPVAQKMAADLGVDLRSITGSGERGKITKDDIRQVKGEEAPAPADKTQEAAPSPAPAPTQPEPKPASAAPPTPAKDVLEQIPLKGIRAVVSRRMPESVHTTARVTLVTEVDATDFVALREQLKAKYAEAWGFAPGYNELLAKIVANGLRQFPYMNARLSAEGNVIELLRPINIGIAVDTERGLLVTVLRDVDRKGLQALGNEFRELVGRARNGKSAPDDLSGSTFTISNLGMYRVDAFTPVINLPEAAILGVGRIAPKPVVKGDEVVVRKMMTLSLVFDHRVVDGAPAARFLDYLCELIEEPQLLFITSR
jgi:pyruvate dehydrogenase E2 component (dihydrolipoamide acetyltransferase)